LLRVDREDHGVGPVLDLAQSFVPSSHLTEDREDTIRMPVDRAVSRFLKEMIARKDELGILSYSFAVEQLEDMLLKMIETGESLARRVSDKPAGTEENSEEQKQGEASKSGEKTGADGVAEVPAAKTGTDGGTQAEAERSLSEEVSAESDNS
jgi:hypothetical protein